MLAELRYERDLLPWRFVSLNQIKVDDLRSVEDHRTFPLLSMTSDRSQPIAPPKNHGSPLGSLWSIAPRALRDAIVQSFILEKYQKSLLSEVFVMGQNLGNIHIFHDLH
jgi:hypothetical protein